MNKVGCKIAFFTIVPKSVMYASLIDELVNVGCDITLICPIYVGKSRVEINDKYRTLYFWSMPFFGIGKLKKGIANVVLPYCCYFAIKRLINKEQFDLVIQTTPPIGFLYPIKLLKKYNPFLKFFLILRDIHPEGAKFIGLDKYPMIFKYFRRIEENLYSLADYIGCMSPGNISFIKEKNPSIDSSKLRILQNWQPYHNYFGPKKAILVKYNISGKFVVIYGGNLGRPQNLSIFIKLAQAFKGYDDIVFIIAGKGTEENALKSLAKKLDVNNLKFYDFIPNYEYDELLKSCNVGFISLHPDVPIPNIPSKTISYFKCKLPVLASIDKITDYGTFVLDRNSAGLWSYVGDFEKLVNNLKDMYFNQDNTRTMGENGFMYYKREATSKIACSELLKIVYGDKDF